MSMVDYFSFNTYAFFNCVTKEYCVLVGQQGKKLRMSRRMKKRLKRGMRKGFIFKINK